MSLTKLERTDLVIHMTLAEMFLILLFFGWYGYTKEKSSDADLRDKLSRYEEENKRSKAELERIKDTVNILRKLLGQREHTLAQWTNVTGLEMPPSSKEEFTEWRKEACRSHPKCAPNNILLHAYVINGSTSIELRSVTLLEKLKISSRINTEIRIADIKVIQHILKSVRNYYMTSENNCRFDYELTYHTKADYYDGRELFEDYFYPAGLHKK